VQINEAPALTRLSGILSDDCTPGWLKELHQFLPVKSQFVLSGNVRDQYAIPAPGDERFPVLERTYELFTLKDAIMEILWEAGYRYFVSADPIHGLTVLAPPAAPSEQYEQSARRFFEKRGEAFKLAFKQASPRFSAAASFDRAVEFAEALANDPSEKCAIFFEYLMGQTEQGQTKESTPFVRSLISSYEAPVHEVGFNPILWICDRENDLPPWFSLNNPRVRSLFVGRPDALIRTRVIRDLIKQLPDCPAGAAERAAIVETFVHQTEGMTTNDLDFITIFCKKQHLPATQIGQAARRYKLGVTEDRWERVDTGVFEKAKQTIANRLKGQDRAVTKTLDILLRALMGLSGSQASGSSGKPKGVLFFAGPTGVGKTELAKTLAEALFGDEQAYIRFDMSEFNHEHADQRLIGAPPGYVGFESGGELTDAIRQKPFSLVLFDEIEKAHSKILDKFLQILDDGQLTSGKGERVYFSDAIIVFTSNLGVAGISPNTDFDTMEKDVVAGIRSFFTEKINRPELLNRLGDNIVVFDFIRKPDPAIRIVVKMIENILARVQDRSNIEITIDGFDPTIRTAPDPLTPFGFLYDVCTEDLRNGGRGIGSLLETWLVNPLARKLWEITGADASGAARRFAITAVSKTAEGPDLRLKEQ
jgi:Cdc48 subfamily AAA family protein